MPDSTPTTRTFTVTDSQTGWRSDRALCALAPDINRRNAKLLFHARLIRFKGKLASGSERVDAGDTFEVPALESDAVKNVLEEADAPKLATAHGRQIARVYEDDVLLVIQKPPEIPVHHGQGGFTRRDTLEDVMSAVYPPPPNAARGQQGFYFVHRLDMETSGLLLIAKNDPVRDALIKDFSERRIQKEYLAIVTGEPKWDKILCKKPITYVKSDDGPVVALRDGARPFYKRGRPKPKLRGVKKGVALEEGSEDGKACETLFDVVMRFKGYTLVRAQPKTGRTHQIRVHLQSLGHALAYDPLYGRVSPLRLREFDLRSGETDAGEVVVLNRLPLHAWKLRFTHPVSKEGVKFEAPIPRDLKEFLRILKNWRNKDKSATREWE